MNSMKTLRERRGSLVRDAQNIIDSSVREGRVPSAGDETRIQNIRRDIFSVDCDIQKLNAELRSGISMPGACLGDLPLEGYSLVRALNGAASGHLDGIEAEASQEIARRSGVNPSGFFVPNAALIERRAMSVSGDSGNYGGRAVQTDVSEDFIAALRPMSRVIQAGAQVFAGLSHSLAFPAQAAASTASWKGEVAELDQATSTINQIELSPKRVGAHTEMSNQLLIQTNSAVDRFVRADLLGAIASAIDAAAIAGAGSPAPTGILSTSGIGDVAGGTNGLAPTWAHIVALIGKVADANADLGKLAFLTNSKAMARLRSTPKVASTDSKMILEGNSLLDYPIYGSNNVPSTLTKGTASGVCSAIIFGNFEDILIGQFGLGSDVIVDRFSKATNGITRIVVNSYVDVALRRAASFSAFKDVLTT
jgi:HK97 family phage major capsid protein